MPFAKRLRYFLLVFSTAFLVAQIVKNLPEMQETQVQSLDQEEGTGSSFQYSCLENPMDRGGWWATAHGVTESQTQLSE